MEERPHLPRRDRQGPRDHSAPHPRKTSPRLRLQPSASQRRRHLRPRLRKRLRMRKYFFHEHWTKGHRTTIHIGSCHHCNDGRGKETVARSPANAKWHGPFASLSEAVQYARMQNAPTNNIDTCIGRKSEY